MHACMSRAMHVRVRPYPSESAGEGAMCAGSSEAAADGTTEMLGKSDKTSDGNPWLSPRSCIDFGPIGMHLILA